MAKKNRLARDNFKFTQIELLRHIQNNRDQLLNEAAAFAENKKRGFAFKISLQPGEAEKQNFLNTELNETKSFLEQPSVTNLLAIFDHSIHETYEQEVKNLTEEQFRTMYEKLFVIEYDIEIDEAREMLSQLDNIGIEEMKRVYELIYTKAHTEKIYYQFLCDQDYELKSQPFFDGFHSDELILPDLNAIDGQAGSDQEIEFLDPNPIKWMGTNKTEFVQFVYGLAEGGLITNQTDEVTKLVEQLAVMLQFDLGKNWQSNHSKSINNRNNDYQPEIFDRMKKAYATYAERLIQGTRKRRKP